MSDVPATAIESAAARRVDADSPWLGLLPFTEETQRFFFGREEEIREVFLRVRDHPFTVLYGQSGYGKTSLLSAGLIPKLRADSYRPLLLRLRFEKDDTPPIEQVRAALATVCADDAAPAASLLSLWGDATLWECFHHSALRAASLKNSPPVLIFDQFEEVFTLGATQRLQADISEFAVEMADLAENRPPVSVQSRLLNNLELASELDFAPSPLRIIITLREDFLSHLESWKAALPSLMRNRMALQLLRGPQAWEAVVRPGRIDGRNLVSDEVGAQIVRVIAHRPPDTPLEEITAVPPLLSLLCDELNRARESAPTITADLVEQRHGDIFHSFYARCFDGFPPAVQHFVEDRLVTVGGHRNVAAREDAEAELARAGVTTPDTVVDTLLARRLLSVEERGGTQRLEITHDVLAPLVVESRDKRREREQAAERLEEDRAARKVREMRRLRRLLAATSIAALLAIVGMGYALKLKGEARFQSQAATKAAHLADYQRHLAEESQKKNSAMLVEAARSDLFVADDRFSKGEKPAAFAYLARSIAYDPQSTFAAEKAVAALNTWDFALPSVFLQGHSGEVHCAVFSPNGQQVVTASADSTARIWDAETGKLLTTLLHENGVSSAAFSPDGARIVTASLDKTARIWESGTGKLLLIIRHEQEVYDATFTPDGASIVTVSGDNIARTWAADTGKQIDNFAPKVFVPQFDLHGDIINSKENTNDFSWRIASPVPVGSDEFMRLAAPDDKSVRIRTAEESPNGKYFLEAASNGYMRISLASSSDPDNRDWSTITMKDPSGRLLSAHFSPDGRFVISTSENGAARLWSPSGTLVMTIAGHNGPVWSADFDRASQRCVTASSDGTARIWPTKATSLGIMLVGHMNRVASARFSPNGRKVLTASADKTAKVWDAQTGNLISDLRQHSASVERAEFSPDGLQIVTASMDGTARVWSGSDGGVPIVLQHAGPVNSALFSPNGQEIVTGSEDTTTRIWDAKTGHELLKIQGDGGRVVGAEFSPDGTHILSASMDGHAQVSDARTGEHPITMTVEANGVRLAHYSSDGARIVTASTDKTAELWDSLTGQMITPPLRHQDDVWSAVFSSTGDRVVTASGDLLHSNEPWAKVWDVASGKLLAELKGHLDTVLDAQFSPDNRRIVTASADKTARLWDPQGEGKLVATLRGHRELLGSARFSADGQHIVTASADDTARVWTILPSSAGGPPDWFGDFLHYMAQQQLNADAELENISLADWLALRDRLRQIVRETAGQETPYLRVLRHFVHE